LLAVKDRHAQTGARKLQRYGSANHATACNGRIELLHESSYRIYPRASFAAKSLHERNVYPAKEHWL